MFQALALCQMLTAKVGSLPDKIFNYQKLPIVELYQFVIKNLSTPEKTHSSFKLVPWHEIYTRKSINGFLRQHKYFLKMALINHLEFSNATIKIQ